ncbi:MAG: pantetheine-phosphate adenylyltransferase [Cytophagaceae bacterium SCN 52-12]|nr:MAG: pantetheine-phosphate adenylyltransferase [Cytophagaceae bacterium SCN 52-12]
MKKTALFPGSFDPFTKGHHDIVTRGMTLFDEIIIGIGTNLNKKRFFPIEVMEKLIAGSFAGNDRIRVISYDSLTAKIAREMGARYILRGLRNTTDFEYENAISQVNRYVYEEIETVFLITSPHLAPISSSIVRDLYRYGQNVDEFLPYRLPEELAVQ